MESYSYIATNKVDFKVISRNKVRPKAKTSLSEPKAAKAPSKTVGSKPSKKPSLEIIFEKAGFNSVESENITFEVKSQKGEIDHIFVYENIIVLCEKTTSSDPKKHFRKKQALYKIIDEKKEEFLESFQEKFLQKFSRPSCLINPKYTSKDLVWRYLYYADRHDFAPGYTQNSDPIKIFSPHDASYFQSLVNTIEKSAKYEIFKYFEIKTGMIGDAKLSGKRTSVSSFSGFALPKEHSNYPDGFLILSFYADPNSLIKCAYVLRRNGWEDRDLSYQRILDRDKLNTMREYLSRDEKVFINNLIVTLPHNTKITKKDGMPYVADTATGVEEVEINMPDEIGCIGIIDGQHRIFSYFEGTDKNDFEINKLRARQNLLVTAILYPPGYKEDEKIKFEASLFLKINETQKTVESELRQDLQVVINPEQPIALARAVLAKLAEKGALQDKIALYRSDADKPIVATSLASYVVSQMVGPKSALFKNWEKNQKMQVDLSLKDQRDQFIDFCTNELNKMLSAAGSILDKKWNDMEKGGVLNTTVAGGLFHAFNKIYKKNPDANFKEILNGIEEFDFSRYKSSAWAAMSTALLKKINFQ